MPKENDVYRFIVRYKTAHAGNSPTFDEIMAGCEISSKSVVFQILSDLQDQSILKYDGVRNIDIPNSKWTVEEA